LLSRPAAATVLGVSVIRLPDVVRNKAQSAGVGAWVEALPGLVHELAREWSFTLGRQLTGGTEAFVAEVALADGRLAVLKLVVPHDRAGVGHEITALRLAQGEGCAELLRADADRGALLLERLGPSMFELGLPIETRQRALCAAARRVWRRVPEASLPTGAEKGRWLADFIPSTWEALGRPCSERAVAHAVACAERRIAAHDDERSVLVHGDVHQWNALRVGKDERDGFKLVDPDGLRAEAEYDLGILMREDPVELLVEGPRRRAVRLAAWTGCDAAAIWEWGVAERVSTGLIATQIELQPEGEQMLDAAERIAADPEARSEH
jgi:streptomycin 6-kinase